MLQNRRPIFLSLLLDIIFLVLSASESLSLQVRCTRVVDGDTIVVRIATGKLEKVRLLCVNTLSLCTTIRSRTSPWARGHPEPAKLTKELRFCLRANYVNYFSPSATIKISVFTRALYRGLPLGGGRAGRLIEGMCRVRCVGHEAKLRLETIY